jgi:hypothetical protein
MYRKQCGGSFITFCLASPPTSLPFVMNVSDVILFFMLKPEKNQIHLCFYTNKIDILAISDRLTGFLRLI